MKNRNLLCYALDYISIAALACAGAALLAAIAFAGADLEATLMNTFHLALKGAVVGFMLGRAVEIVAVLRTVPAAAPAEEAGSVVADNVEALPEIGQLPRAA